MRAYMALADARSRHVFRNLLVHRLADPRFADIATDARRAAALRAFMTMDIPEQPSDIFPTVDALGSPLTLFTFPFGRSTLTLATTKYSLYWAFCNDQYHLERSGIV